MKFYVINLDRSFDRWQHIEQQFKKLGLLPERIAAVDGKSLSSSMANCYVAGRYSPLKNTEIACFLSHRKCWEVICESNDDYAMVFEDDVFISSQLNDFLLTGLWQQGIDLLSVEKFYSPLKVKPKEFLVDGPFSIYRVVEDNPGTGGYLISKKRARDLLKQSENFCHLVDSYMFSPRRIIGSKYGSFQLSPALCTQGWQNPEFSASHALAPTTMLANNDIALSARVKKYSMGDQCERAKANIKKYLLAIGSIRKNIDFNE
ncbi:glycosyltransferase family 25 protein [Bartonella sp. HY329]|uniref:glycosyltransferase family 25 protein n=1 Tax=unclassified Bartonella TaxID=2645622 RepID=UPI0021C772B1|nr:MULTISPECIES: glycosyltransferase family 25 protein [unclassified Bartonella]UXM95182.1 glycosyltransferase family 25 protein [Bartonella sp. HY329]UXN09505.1 glycosyltransferase family 25 protein [Bartonella sp. HY328]